MSTQLLRNPTNIGDIFFSGSQPVQKGQEVVWILDETWAFKATEPVAVSMNNTPFVNLNTGQTFIIKQGAKYVFDADTIVALAYPQDVTQDIIIENDIYNNNMSTIIVESDKTPIARIVASHTSCIQGTVVTFNGSNSYSPDTPPESLTYQWYIQGQAVSTASSFTYTANTVGAIDVLLVVTDESGRKGDDSYTLAVQEKTYISNTYVDNTQYVGQVPEATWYPIFSVTADEATPNAQNALQFSAGFGMAFLAGNVYAPATVQLRFKVGSTVLFTRSYTNTQTDYQAPLTITDSYTFSRTINIGDIISIEAYWTDANQYASLSSVCSNGCINGDMQVTSNEQ